MKKRIVLAGGSGFLGQSLAAALVAQGWEVHLLSRTAKEGGPYRTWAWDGSHLGPWVEALKGASALVNLTGKSVNCRYDEANREEIVRSRLDSVAVLQEALKSLEDGPKVWVQCGSLAIFGDAGDRVCGESSELGTGFSVEVCKAWEKAFAEVELPGLRKVYLRIGFVLAPDGGALGTLAKLTRAFLGGSVGNGRQFISWLHIDDFVAMVMDALVNDRMQGTYNATGVLPVTNAEFMQKLRKALGRPWSPPAPALAVMVGALFMGTESELALTGRRCMPKRLLEEGFRFEHWDLDQALTGLFAEA